MTTLDRRPLIILALEAILDEQLQVRDGARWIPDCLRALDAPIVVVGDVSATTRRILAGQAAEPEIARAVDALAAAAERFKLGFEPWYLSVCLGDYRSLPQAEDGPVLNIRDLWQINVGMRDAWRRPPAVTASPVFGAFPSALCAFANAQHCFLKNADPAASIIISETELWSRTGFQWIGAAGLREGPHADGWAVLDGLAQRRAAS